MPLFLSTMFMTQLWLHNTVYFFRILYWTNTLKIMYSVFWADWQVPQPTTSMSAHLPWLFGKCVLACGLRWLTGVLGVCERMLLGSRPTQVPDQLNTNDVQYHIELHAVLQSTFGGAGRVSHITELHKPQLKFISTVPQQRVIHFYHKLTSNV